MKETLLQTKFVSLPFETLGDSEAKREFSGPKGLTKAGPKQSYNN